MFYICELLAIQKLGSNYLHLSSLHVKLFTLGPDIKLSKYMKRKIGKGELFVFGMYIYIYVMDMQLITMAIPIWSRAGSSPLMGGAWV